MAALESPEAVRNADAIAAVEGIDVLFIGTGGAVHNLYRNVWGPIMKHADNFALEVPPGNWALDFRQEFEDAMTKCSGPELRRALASLMKLPGFRDAHGTGARAVGGLTSRPTPRLTGS